MPSLLRAAIPALAALSLAALPAAANGAHEWSYVSEVRANPYDTTLRLSLAVPETDDVIAVADCVLGPAGPAISMDLAADVTGMADGDPATVRFTAADGRTADASGTVIGTTAAVGITGLRLAMETSNPLWGMIMSASSIDYQLTSGGASFNLPLSQYSITAVFVNDCNNIVDLAETGTGGRPLTPTTPAPPMPESVQPVEFSCDRLGTVVSQVRGASQAVNFVNASHEDRRLIWIDGTNTQIELALLEPGESVIFDTAPGHVWVIADPLRNCLTMMAPVGGVPIYGIALPD